MRQFFVKDFSNNYFTFDDEDIHHILNVLRLKNDDIVNIIYKEEVYETQLEIKNKEVKAILIRKLDYNNELSCEVTLIYALVKSDKFEFVIQKASELGVTRIIPFAAKRSISILEKNKEDKKIQRWNKIAFQACKQSNRNKIVKIETVKTLNQLLDFKSQINMIADENESVNNNNTKLFSLLENTPQSITIVVGPEGGFDNNEIDYLNENGFISVSLGKRILRSETAPIYLMSVIAFMTEMSKTNGK